MKLGNYSNMIISDYAWFSQNMMKNKINIRKEKVKIKITLKSLSYFICYLKFVNYFPPMRED